MKYIRTKDGVYEDKYVHIKVDKNGYVVMEYKGEHFEAPTNVKSADTIQKLVITGDLLIVEDRTTSYPYATFPHIYNEQRPFAYDCAIFKLVELYIKNQKGNYIKVAQKSEKSDELELL